MHHLARLKYRPDDFENEYFNRMDKNLFDPVGNFFLRG
jgi:hypothetical protein